MTDTATPPPWRTTPRAMTLRDGRAVVLRAMEPDDADELAAFFGSLTDREVYYFYGRDADAARRIAANAPTDPAYRLVAVADAAPGRRIVGYQYLEWTGDQPPVFGACLRPGVQSGGLGWAMIDELVRSAAESGVPRARLTVHPDNWRALRLYQRVGFLMTGDFDNDHQRVKQYRMEADLTAPRPTITEDVTVIPSPGLGVAGAARRIQDALEHVLGARPFVLDRPAKPGGEVVLVASLGPEATPWSHETGPAEEPSDGWVVRLDARRVLVAGRGQLALERAAERYAERAGAGLDPADPAV